MAHMKKAEKSRIHAKKRRTEEAKEINKIAELLPLPSSVTQKLDKASILRLAITFLRLKQYVGEDKGILEQIALSEVNEGHMMLETLSGFFTIISVQEEILFVSENVEKHLGLKQVDMLGKNIFEFVYEKDREEFLKQFNTKYQGREISGVGLSSQGQPIEMKFRCSTAAATAPVLELHRQFFLRMKCAYQKGVTHQRQHLLPWPAGTQVASDYLLLQWTGSLHYDEKGQVSFLAAVARPLQPTPVMELKMDGNMFISRHSLDMRFMYCDPRLSTLLGYEPNEIAENSMYYYLHPADLNVCNSCHKDLITAGTSISKYYRFLSKNNEWCWLQTRATIVYNTVRQPQYIVCMNYIVSEKEGRRYLVEHVNGGSKKRKKSLPAVIDIGTSPIHTEQCITHITSNISGIQLNDHMMSTLLTQSNQHPSQEQAVYLAASSPAHSSHHSSPKKSQYSPSSEYSSQSSPDSETEQISRPPHATSRDTVLPGTKAGGSPTFYLPPENVDLPDPMPEDSLALGNLWLSVHSIIDPAVQYSAEIIPPSLASEMEEITFDYCHQLMTNSTQTALNLYCDPNPEEPPKDTWGKAENLVNREAVNMFKKFKTQKEVVMHQSRSSSTLSTPHSTCTSSYSSLTSRTPSSDISTKAKVLESCGSMGFQVDPKAPQTEINRQPSADSVTTTEFEVENPPEDPTFEEALEAAGYSELHGLDEFLPYYDELQLIDQSDEFSVTSTVTPLHIPEDVLTPEPPFHHSRGSMESLHSFMSLSELPIARSQADIHRLRSNESHMSLTSNQSISVLPSINSLMDVSCPYTSPQSDNRNGNDLYERLLEQDELHCSRYIDYWLNHQ